MQFAARPAFWWFAFTAWFVTLWFLSGGPGPDLDNSFWSLFSRPDKILHFGYFGLGALCLGIALSLGEETRVTRAPGWRWLLIVVCLVAVGVIDEWHQTFTPGRDGGDLYDGIADVLGSAVGAAFSIPVAGRIRAMATRIRAT